MSSSARCAPLHMATCALSPRARSAAKLPATPTSPARAPLSPSRPPSCARAGSCAGTKTKVSPVNRAAKHSFDQSGSDTGATLWALEQSCGVWGSASLFGRAQLRSAREHNWPDAS
jgi:hypothetical protein